MAEYSLQIGAVVAGKYKVLSVLGAGGMGAVYLAENLDIGREVAIKVLHAKIGEDPAVRQRFRQEARTSGMIKHPGIVDVLDMGETEQGEAFIVMEKLEGQTLGTRIKQRGRLSVEESISVIAEALDAIGAAHDKGVVHRDLKPDNVFLVWHPRWAVKILDFGISRFLNSEEVRLTASNTLMGSVLYMPPEQARDARAAGPAADLYALGATLYHALTGQPPFMGESYTEVLTRVIGEPPTAIQVLRPDLPPELAALVMQLLLKDPLARPVSAEAVRTALLAIVPTPAPLEPPPRPSKIGGFSDTAIPVKNLAETAEASQPPAIPLGVTADSEKTGIPPSLRIPKGAATSSIVGEVTHAPPTMPPATGKRTVIVILGASLAAVAATVIALQVTRVPPAVKPPVDAPSDSMVDAAPSTDAPAVIDATALDATGPLDAGTRRRTDGGPAATRQVPDAGVTPPAPQDATLTQLQPLPE